MELTDLGLDSWFHDCLAGRRPSDHRLARVSAVDRGGFLICNEAGEVPAELSGKLRFSARAFVDLPCVGDWVLAKYHNAGASAIIHDVLPRKTFLRRKCAGQSVDLQMIAANVDTAFIVQSCHYDFNLRRFDRYLVMANEGQIEPVLVLTKTDLVTADELRGKITAIREAGLTAAVVEVSNATGAGLDALRRLLIPGKTYCLLGSSGVGKTTIINRLAGRDAFDTREVSATGEGTHTTVRRQLITLPHGPMLIDTPGMRELGILASADAIEDSFGDLHGLAASCQYADCRHAGEPGCAVRLAMEDGVVSADRYRNYLKLKAESAFYELSYVDKRKRDKAFGKRIKLAKTQTRR